MPVSAAIFDVDGTLIDSVDQHARAWQEALAHFGKNVAFEDIRSQIGKGGDQIVPVYFQNPEAERVGKEVREFEKQVFRGKYMHEVRAFPYVRELFERIHHAGLKTALATSSPTLELQHNKKLADIEDLVDAESNADDAEKSKPHPDIFQAVLEKLKDVRPEDAIAIGDSPYDAEAARNAGIRAIGFRCGGFPENWLRQAGCIAIYDGPHDLLQNLDASPLAQT
jgi:HAD superfamily hydrolase (TIGR01509 family)